MKWLAYGLIAVVVLAVVLVFRRLFSGVGDAAGAVGDVAKEAAKVVKGVIQIPGKFWRGMKSVFGAFGRALERLKGLFT